MLPKGGGWGAVLVPRSHWARERRARGGALPRHFPPLFSAATQDEGPALPARSSGGPRPAPV